MVSVAIIVFREVLEIALVVGILLAATRGLAWRNHLVAGGIAAGVLGSLIVAYFAEAISNAVSGMGQELFNATVLFLAAILIGGTVVWMRRHGRFLTQQFTEVGRAISHGEKPLYTLAVVVALSTLREGSETVLFTYGMMASGTTAISVLSGGLMGIIAGTLMGMALYYGMIRIPTKIIFSVISWILVCLAAGMVSQATGFLAAAGFVPELTPTLWDTSMIMPEKSLPGSIFHVLMGYTERPSGIQMLSYLLTLVAIGSVLKFYGDMPVKLAVNTQKAVAVFIATCALMLGSPRDASAIKKVYSPIVEGGEFEVETRGSVDFDERASRDNKQKQKYAVGYGVTNRWFTELYGEIEKDPADDHFDLTAVEWENRYQVFEQGQYWLDAGLYFAYETTVMEKTADKIEGKILLEKPLGDFLHTANIIFEQEVGGGATADTEGGLALSSRYRWKKYFEPGFEWHAGFGELNGGTAYQEQKHQGGPVFYGKFGDHIKYDVGYLFGATDAAPDGMLKWILEYEIHL